MNWENPLIIEAEKIRKNAYAPYSNFKVSCVFEGQNGELYRGVNVENCSYGLSHCAERVALNSAVTQGIDTNLIQRGVIMLDSPKEALPCGACLQVMVELCPHDLKLYLANVRTQHIREINLNELLPHPFTNQFLS